MAITAPATRIGKICGEELDASAFSPDGRVKDGLQARCRACRQILRQDQKINQTSPATSQPTKRCYRCGKYLELSAFGKNAAKPGGLDSSCRQCLNTYRTARNRKKARDLKPQPKPKKTCVDCQQLLDREAFPRLGGAVCRSCRWKRDAKPKKAAKAARASEPVLRQVEACVAPNPLPAQLLRIGLNIRRAAGETFDEPFPPSFLAAIETGCENLPERDRDGWA